jgi:hypothetical protein
MVDVLCSGVIFIMKDRLMTTALTSEPPRLIEMPFYALWHTLPDLTDHIDPFRFVERAAAYKRLIECTNTGGVFGEYNEMNFFWGYLAQLHWQYESGRLHGLDTPKSLIDPASAWGAFNYTLSILPLIAAMQVGLTPAIDIAPAPGAHADRYAHGGGAEPYSIPPAFDETMRKWRAVFEQIAAFPAGQDIEPLRYAVWNAHYDTLHACSVIFAREMNALPPPERDFLFGWVRMVDFLAVAAWRTDLDYMLQYGVGVLPPRMMTAADIPGRIADMNAMTNSNLKNIAQLTTQPGWRFALSLYLWRRAMRSRAARADAPKMLDATFNPHPGNAAERRALLRYMLRP